MTNSLSTKFDQIFYWKHKCHSI